MGLCNALATLGSSMNIIFNDCIEVYIVVYMDVILNESKRKALLLANKILLYLVGKKVSNTVKDQGYCTTRGVGWFDGESMVLSVSCLMLILYRVLATCMINLVMKS